MPNARKLKVFLAANLDGQVKACVATRSQSEAAELLNIPIGDFRSGDAHEIRESPPQDAIDEPGVVFYQSLYAFGKQDSQRWYRLRMDAIRSVNSKAKTP